MARPAAALLALAALLTLAIAEPVRINAGGPYIPSIGWRQDTGLYASPSSLSFTGGGPVTAPGTWGPVYNSHRWAPSGDLEFKIPVPAGAYNVALLFAETWTGSGPGVREMVVKVNGANVNNNGIDNGLLDVFTKAGGLNKPFFVNAGSITAQAGFITVTLERVAGKNNPMISGIVIGGATADALVGGEGIGNAAPSAAPPASVVPSASASEAPSAAPSAAVTSVAPAAPSAAPSTPAPPAGGCPVAASITGKLGTAGFVMNVGGPTVTAIGWAADNTNYIVEADKGLTAGAPTPVVVTGSTWVAPFQTHRYTTGPSLTYRIPVPPGTYSVALLHAESFMTAPGQRLFNILINGEVKQAGFDVFALVGKDKPLYKAYDGVQSVNGFIEIAFTKITENPFVNGIYIQGPGAASLAIGGPEDGNCVSSGAGPLPTVSAVASGKPVETDFAAAHFAHSVAGGPYVETDFDKDGKAAVNLDGSNSHSHKQVGDEVGQIVTYKWTWKDSSNRAAAADGTVTVTTAKATVNFPLGETVITLLVIDQFDNTASETTTVTINSATVAGSYCYFYDLGKTTPTTVSLPVDVKQDPKPKKGTMVGDINFGSTVDFDVPFDDSAFSVRCVYFIDVQASGTISYKIVHSGPVKIYHDGILQASSDSMVVNTVTDTPAKAFSAGLQAWQIHYLRPQNVDGKLALQSSAGVVIPSDIVRHDAAATLPVIVSLSKGTTAPEGGEIIGVFGTAFVNGVSIFFGNVEATTTEVTAGVVQAIAPPGTGTVLITVTTEAGTSNSVSFTYSATDVPVKFIEDYVKTPTGMTYSIPQIAVAAFGPDYRLYLGAVNSKVYALTLDKDMQVTQKCEHSVFQTYPRTVLGLAFNPKSNALKMFIATSTIFWKDRKQFKDFGSGWTNGKIQSLTIKPNNGCFNNDLTDVITGLPVSNHDHAINAITFLPSGMMLIAVGGFTNGGISVPGDNLGGVASNPLAGAIVQCPASGTAMEYSNLNDPVKSQIIGGTCTTYATGFRNTYSLEYHTNKHLYATDNGPNQGFGLFSTNCAGGSKASKNIPDKLHLVQPGKCHGHPSINRGECVFEDPSCVQPLIGNLQSSTNGLLEYRSNTFGGKIKGDLFIAKFAVNGNGKLSRAQLNPSGEIKENGFTNFFFPMSGLSIVEGPRGEMVMPRVYQSSILVAKPQYPVPTTTTLISVMPRRGPAGGGATVLLTGHNFGPNPTATFNGKACTNVVSIDADTFTCVTPAGTPNTQVGVSVAGAAGMSISPGTDYWYF